MQLSTKIDVVDSSDIKQTAKELNHQIAEIYGKKFTNTGKISSISLKILKDEFGKYFTRTKPYFLFCVEFLIMLICPKTLKIDY